MGIYQLLTAVFISTIPFFEIQFIYYDNPPFIITIIEVFSILLLPIFLTALIDDIKRKFLPTIFFILFLIPLSISTIYSIDVNHSLVIFRLFISFFIIFVSMKKIFPSVKSREFISIVFLLVSSILSVISIYNTVLLQKFSQDHVNFYGIFYGHNHLSALLVISIPISLYFLKKYNSSKIMKYSAFTVIFLLSVSFLISLSIGGIIAITISFIASYYLFGNKVVSKKIFYGTSAFFAIFALSVFLFFSVTKGIESIDFDKNPVTHSLHRLIFWQRAYSLFLDNPLLGTGPDTFGLVKINDQTPPYSSNAHNFFIQTLSDTGIFGFFTFTILIGSIFIKAYNIIRSNISDKKRLFYISLYVGLFASTLFAAMDFDWYLPTVFTIFWIFASLLTNYAK